MPIYNWSCENCEVAVEVQHKIAERDTPPAPEDGVGCLCEKPEWRRSYPAPQVVGKASYLDGQRKFHDLREANKIKREGYRSRDPQKKLEIAKEIRKIGVRTDGGN